VVLAVGFLPIIARVLERLLPDTKADIERQLRQKEREQEPGDTQDKGDALNPNLSAT
jgi:hypothetical protein